MKYKTIFIILLLGILTGCSFSKSNNFKDNTSNIDGNIQTAEEAKKIYDNLYEKLFNEGKEIYNSALKEEYRVDDNLYYVSLNRLKEDFNYDISDFKDDKGAVCNAAVSGIYFAKNEERELGVSIMVALNGCSTYEAVNKHDNS